MTVIAAGDAKQAGRRAEPREKRTKVIMMVRFYRDSYALTTLGLLGWAGCLSTIRSVPVMAALRRYSSTEARF